MSTKWLRLVKEQRENLIQLNYPDMLVLLLFKMLIQVNMLLIIR